MTNILYLDHYKEVVIYGYSEAGLYDVIDLAQQHMVVYDHTAPCKPKPTLSGRTFTKIPYDSTAIPALCKNTLVAVIIENHLRKKEKRDIIPVIFCLSSTYCDPLPTRIIANKNLTDLSYGSVSHKELRRIYKLLNYPDPEIKKIAQETFKFVHVNFSTLKDNHPPLTLEEISPPWESESTEWAEALELKKSIKRSPSTLFSKLDWRALLQQTCQDL